MSGFLDRGLDSVKETQEAIREHVRDVMAVSATLDPANGDGDRRQVEFARLQERFRGDGGPVHQHMAELMKSFQPGLFVGGDDPDLALDNLDLERWFRLPKSHERRIHGHRHAGMRIVQEGPTLLPTLDAHRDHPEPFGAADLLPYRQARPPQCQREAIHRRKVMRKARSKKKRHLLLAELERRYIASS